MEILKIRLNDDFITLVEKKYLPKSRTVPQGMKGDKIIYAIDDVPDITYVFHSIQTSSGKLVAHEDLIHEFIELLHSFVGTHLNANKTYLFSGKEKSGFKAAITTQEKNIFLKIIVADENYFLDKYQCRVVSSKLSKIYSKCEFNFYQ